MNEPRRRPQPGRRPQQHQPPRNKARSLDLWRPVSPLPPVEPIVPASDPTALLRSLGDPPLPGQVAEHYMAAVIDRAAILATALAASAGLLGEAGDDAG